MKQIFEKVSQGPKKLKGGTIWAFQHPFCCNTPEKLKERSFGGKFFLKKVAQCRKN